MAADDTLTHSSTLRSPKPTRPRLSSRHADPRRYPAGVAYMDGQYLPMSEAKISVLDYGLLHSDATYDVVHVWKGAFFRLGDHLDRFFRGMEELHMSIPYRKADVTDILHNCVALSELQSAYVEFVCTRGTSPTFSRDPRDAENRFFAFAIPFNSIANEIQMERGLHIATTGIPRIAPASVDPKIKNYHWLDFVKALYQVYDSGADSAVLLDAQGNVAEGPGFNVFLVKNGDASTPQSGILPGVTRQTVFDICSRLDVPCQSCAISIDDLKAADEVFVTSTAGGIMPVTQIDNQNVGSGMVGNLVKKIRDTYWRMHRQATYSEVVKY